MRTMTKTTAVLTFACDNFDAVQAVLAISRGDTPSAEGFRAAVALGLADYNLRDGYSLHPGAREIVAVLG